MDYDQADPSRGFYKLKESIGSLLFCWCRLEDSGASALRAAKGDSSKVPGSFAEQLAEWKALLEVGFRGNDQLTEELTDLIERIDSARRRRNLIVHGLSGVCSDSRKGEPHITCREGEHGRRTHVKISQSELTDLMQKIDRCRVDIERLAFLGRSGTVKGR
jgi:hypothetical protein